MFVFKFYTLHFTLAKHSLVTKNWILNSFPPYVYVGIELAILTDNCEQCVNCKPYGVHTIPNSWSTFFYFTLSDALHFFLLPNTKGRKIQIKQQLGSENSIWFQFGKFLWLYLIAVVFSFRSNFWFLVKFHKLNWFFNIILSGIRNI